MNNPDSSREQTFFFLALQFEPKYNPSDQESECQEKPIRLYRQINVSSEKVVYKIGKLGEHLKRDWGLGIRDWG